MSHKFKSNKEKGTPAISTASLPDIVFMLLFFFMVTTVMREVTMKVKVVPPKATEVKKLDKKSLVSYIYAGKPHEQFKSVYGKSPRIQLNDAISDIKDIPDFIAKERASHKEEEIPLLTTSIKADKEVEMGIISDIKQQLREAQAYKINYSTLKGDVLDNLK